MADWTNIARPYAKAVFMHALEQKALPVWSLWLSQLDSVALCPEMLAFIDNPETTAQQHQDAVRDVMLALPGSAKKLPEVLDAFIHVLADNRRLPVLPAIAAQFEALRAEAEHRVTVQVESFLPLNDAEEARLIDRLTKRLNREVTLEVSINPDLLGGAVISAKDWVINGSVKGQLNKLGADLVASSRG
ncbi:MAG: F0F1 ATP synthase subunit delta [Gammaproteobacteria bacterium]|nr:F0F1 ATP synthase subunit delta [Gammaproteobacteria bacterium]